MFFVITKLSQSQVRDRESQISSSVSEYMEILDNILEIKKNIDGNLARLEKFDKTRLRTAFARSAGFKIAFSVKSTRLCLISASSVLSKISNIMVRTRVASSRLQDLASDPSVQ